MAANSTRAACAAVCMLVSTLAPASPSLLEVVRSCESQADDAARLRCYDHGVAQFKGVDAAAGDPRCTNTGTANAPVSPKPAAAAQSTPKAAVTNPAAATEGFGLTNSQLLAKQSGEEHAQPLKRVTARIVTLSQGAKGHLVIHLDNDQVWEQTEAGPDLRIGSGDAVAIDRGLLGAYWLSAVSGRLAIKVQRLQ